MASETKASLNSLEKTLEVYFRDKAPKIPADIQKLIVTYGPWLIVITLVLAIPVVLAAFGLGALMAPLSFLGGATSGFSFSISYILFLAIFILEILALQGLFKRTIQGWRMLYYAVLVSVLQNLISFNLVGLILGGALSFWILFQIKHHYK